MVRPTLREFMDSSMDSYHISGLLGCELVQLLCKKGLHYSCIDHEALIEERDVFVLVSGGENFKSQ